MPAETPQSNSKPQEAQDWRCDICSPHRDFIQKIFITILFALVLINLWQRAEVLLLVFAGLLPAIFLRSLSDSLSERRFLKNFRLRSREKQENLSPPPCRFQINAIQIRNK